MASWANAAFPRMTSPVGTISHLDVVVDELKQQVKILGVEQLEISPHEGQMILDDALAQVPIDRAGFVCHNRSLHRRCVLISCGALLRGDHRASRPAPNSRWRLAGKSGSPRCPDPQMLLLHSSPVAPLRRAPRAMV